MKKELKHDRSTKTASDRLDTTLVAAEDGGEKDPCADLTKEQRLEARAERLEGLFFQARDLEAEEGRLLAQTDRLVSKAKHLISEPSQQDRPDTEVASLNAGGGAAEIELSESAKRQARELLSAAAKLHAQAGDAEISSPEGKLELRSGRDDSVVATFLPGNSIPTSKQRIEALKLRVYDAIGLAPEWRSPEGIRRLFGSEVLLDGRAVCYWAALEKAFSLDDSRFEEWLSARRPRKGVTIAESRPFGTQEWVSGRKLLLAGDGWHYADEMATDVDVEEMSPMGGKKPLKQVWQKGRFLALLSPSE